MISTQRSVLKVARTVSNVFLATEVLIELMVCVRIVNIFSGVVSVLDCYLSGSVNNVTL